MRAFAFSRRFRAITPYFGRVGALLSTSRRRRASRAVFICVACGGCVEHAAREYVLRDVRLDKHRRSCCIQGSLCDSSACVSRWTMCSARGHPAASRSIVMSTNDHSAVVSTIAARLTSTSHAVMPATVRRAPQPARSFVVVNIDAPTATMDTTINPRRMRSLSRSVIPSRWHCWMITMATRHVGSTGKAKRIT